MLLQQPEKWSWKKQGAVEVAIVSHGSFHMLPHLIIHIYIYAWLYAFVIFWVVYGQFTQLERFLSGNLHLTVLFCWYCIPFLFWFKPMLASRTDPHEQHYDRMWLFDVLMRSRKYVHVVLYWSYVRHIWSHMHKCLSLRHLMQVRMVFVKIHLSCDFLILQFLLTL